MDLGVSVALVIAADIENATLPDAEYRN